MNFNTSYGIHWLKYEYQRALKKGLRQTEVFWANNSDVANNIANYFEIKDKLPVTVVRHTEYPSPTHEVGLHGVYFRW